MMDFSNSTGSAMASTSCQLRSLPQTQQEWYPDSDGIHHIYNTPAETGKLLDAAQGKNPNHRGTCGIVSCVNILRLAGRIETTELEVLSHAIDHHLCGNRPIAEQSGGTTLKQRQKILRAFGLETEQIPPSIDKIAECVSAGKGVIISVYANRLWKLSCSSNLPHAVVVTSVIKDTSGKVKGFYICDSGHMTNDYAHRYTAEEIAQSLTGRDMNVTKSIIR